MKKYAPLLSTALCTRDNTNEMPSRAVDKPDIDIDIDTDLSIYYLSIYRCGAVPAQ